MRAVFLCLVVFFCFLFCFCLVGGERGKGKGKGKARMGGCVLFCLWAGLWGRFRKGIESLEQKKGDTFRRWGVPLFSWNVPVQSGV